MRRSLVIETAGTASDSPERKRRRTARTWRCRRKSRSGIVRRVPQLGLTTNEDRRIPHSTAEQARRPRSVNGPPGPQGISAPTSTSREKQARVDIAIAGVGLWGNRQRGVPPRLVSAASPGRDSDSVLRILVAALPDFSSHRDEQEEACSCPRSACRASRSQRPRHGAANPHESALIALAARIVYLARLRL